MSKKSSRRLSKKGLNGLVRVNMPEGRRWVYKGEKYQTLREVITAHWLELMKIDLKEPLTN